MTMRLAPIAAILTALGIGWFAHAALPTTAIGRPSSDSGTGAITHFFVRY